MFFHIRENIFHASPFQYTQNPVNSRTLGLAQFGLKIASKSSGLVGRGRPVHGELLIIARGVAEYRAIVCLPPKSVKTKRGGNRSFMVGMRRAERYREQV